MCSTGSTSDDQQLRVDFPKVHDPYTFSHFQMNCTLPAASSDGKSAVRTYRIYQYRKL